MREAATVAAQAERRARDVQQVFGVAAVEDGEVGLHAEVAGVDAQQAGGDGVERAAPDALARRGRAPTAVGGEQRCRRGAASRRRRAA